jgi:formylglycine-generating enzyme required for sulfatase activity
VEKLLARGLIRNGRRIMMEASAMRDEYGVSQTALELLHDERLLKREARFAELEARYYPVMVSVRGSSDLPGFKLAKTETTVWQYNLFLNAQGKNILDETTFKRPGWGWEGNNPVVFVSWYDAVQYANWLSEQRGLTPAYTIDREQKDTNNISEIDKLKWTVTLRENAKGYRLPSNVEWEYAARGGPNRAAFEYAGSDQPDGVAWHKGNSGNRAQPVGIKLPNGAGLHDFSGNSWEWCYDWDAASFGRYRVVRGGSWRTTGRISDGGTRTPDSREDHYSFRVAQ